MAPFAGTIAESHPPPTTPLPGPTTTYSPVTPTTASSNSTRAWTRSAQGTLIFAALPVVNTIDFLFACL